MKSIGIITDGKNLSVQESINTDLTSVFNNTIYINFYHIDELIYSKRISDDVVLVLDNERLPIVGKYVENKENIILVERTFKKSDILPVFEIPKGSKVLVVNSTWQTTLEAVSHLYQIIDNYLNLIPYQVGELYRDISIAITPGESEYVPHYIKNIIDVKNRCISVYTFIKIFNKLKVDDKKTISNLMSYSEKIIDINSSINIQYKDLFIKNALLENITSKLDEGILVVDKDYNILFINEKGKNLLGIDERTKCLHKVIDNEIIYFDDTLRDMLLKHNNKNILLSKSKINYYENQEDYIFSLKEDFYIKNLGISLNNEMKKKGFFAKYTFDHILHKSSVMDKTINFAKKIAQSEYNILIIGDTGTGKEMFAQSIHNSSCRWKGPFVAVNCAALPENLLESELFGYEKGAFTGANKEGKIGLFELASSGTLFLDEIGDMPYSLQSRLLRVIQEKQIMRLGGDKLIDIDVRIISATNKDVDILIKQKKFRQDLFFRINTFQLNIPNLIERKEDILYLLDIFTDSISSNLSGELKSTLLNYKWDGNVRELINVANYVNLMKSDIPNYIKDEAVKLDNTINLKSLSIYQAYRILDNIDCYNEAGETVGREKLLREIKKENLNIGEHILNKALAELELYGFIEINLGRRGTLITNKGKIYKKQLKERILNSVK